MRREWRFSAQSRASRTKFTNAEPRGFPADLIGAFVDRLPIGWHALSGRGATARQRQLIDDLRLLDRVRPALTPAGDPYSLEPSRYTSSAGAAVVLALASVQTLICLSAVAGAVLTGHAIVHTSRLVLAAGFSAAAVVVAAAAARDRRTLGLIAALVAVASAFARGSTFGLPLPSSTLLRLLIHGTLPIAFAPAALWQFALAFPRVERFTTFDVVARRAMAAAWLIGGVLFGAMLGAELGLRRVAPIAGRNGPTHTFWDVLVLALLPAIVVLAARSRRAPPAERRRIARFAETLAAGGAPLLVLGAFRMAIPDVDRWFVASGAGGHIWIDRLVLWPLAATPVLSSAVLLLDRPFDAQTTPSLPSASRLASATVSICVMTPFVMLGAAVYRVRQIPIADLVGTAQGWELVIAAGASGVALLIVAWRIATGGRFVLAASDRRRLSGAIDRIRHTRGERELAAVLASEIVAGTRAVFGRALFPASDGSYMDPSGAIAPLTSAAALSEIFRRTPGAIDVSERALGALLPPIERSWVSSNGIEMAAALRGRTGESSAILTFGKRSAGRFDRRDRWLAATLIDAAAAASTGDARTERRRRGRQEPAFECSKCGTVAQSFSASCSCQRGLVLSALPRSLGGRFAIERRLGAGGMGVVYRGRDVRLRRAVALKTVPALRGEAAAPLRREARAMASLNHDALATLYALEFWRGTPVLVEEYLPGSTLATRLASRRLQPSEAVAIAVRIADGIAYMHGCGVLHGDVKPGNIAFTEIGCAKLLDFGLSTLIDCAVHGGAGTPEYLPPECVGRTSGAPSLDLWALGVTLLEMIAGQEARTAARSPRTLAAVLSGPSFERDSGLRQFFERALALDAAARFTTAMEMARALRSLSTE